MKLYRNAIILVVVLGLLVGAYFFISSKSSNSAEADESTDATINVISVEQDKIISLAFNNENGSFTLTKKDKAWTVSPTSELAIDTTVADASAIDISTIVADKVIEENATNLAQYGLDKPATIKVGLSDGTFKEIEIGSNSPTNEGIYVKNKGESKVYLVGTYYSSKLILSKGYFVNKDILPVEATTLKKFAYEKNGEMQYAVSIASESEMTIISPVKEVADATKVKSILENVVTLVIKDIIDENPTDLAKYGLDKPAYSIEYGDSTATKKILFGKDVEKGAVVYAKFAEEKTVFTIDISSLTFLDKKLSDVIDKMIYLVNIDQVNKIDLYLDGKKIVSDITTFDDDSDKEDIFKVDGKDANMNDANGKSLFRNFYSSMIGLIMTQYEPGAKPTGSPEVSIKYYLKADSKTVTIDLISKDSNYYYIMKDGVYTNKIILKNDLNEDDGIRTTYQTLKKAIDEAK